MTAFPNRFAGTCAVCQTRIPAQAGVCEKINGAWLVRCAQPCQVAPVQKKTVPVVGDLSSILALFERAKNHLKFPAIVVGVPALGADGEWSRDEHGAMIWSGLSLRVNVAGERARVPGSLTVVDAARTDAGSRDWFGRILLDGVYQPSASGSSPAVIKRLREFACDPARVAGEDGRLHGRCCFCRLPLSDERSTAVGFGRKCADNFGLNWGKRPVEFAAGSDARAMEPV